MARAERRLEHERNRVLRRADWRFLGPDPMPKKSVCFSNGPMSDAVAAVSERVVDPRLAARDGDCDLAVAVDPDPATLAAAWASLRPGGWCYSEWTARGLRPRAIAKRLRAVGFVGVTCYWPRPGPAQGAALWYTGGAPGVLRDIVLNRPPVAGPGRRLKASLRRLKWTLRPRLGLAYPLAVIAHKPGYEVAGARRIEGTSRIAPAPVGAPDAAADLPSLDRPLTEFVRGHWSEWDLGSPPRDLSTLLVTGGFRSINKVVALVFADADPRPRIAVKISRTPDSVRGLLREAATLRMLGERHGGVPGAPRALFVRRHGRDVALGETAMPGAPLNTLLGRDNFPALARTATAWLVALAGPPAPVPPSAFTDRLVAPVLDDFASSFGPVLDPGMLEESVAIVSTLGPCSIVCEQRDFSPWNVLVTPDGELSVLDWESSEPRGLPALDLLYFLAHFAFSLDRAHRAGTVRESYRATLTPSSFTGAVARECLDEYLARTGLSAENLPALRQLLWMLHSRSEYGHFVADAGGRPAPDALRTSVFLALWEEEVRADGAVRG